MTHGHYKKLRRNWRGHITIPNACPLCGRVPKVTHKYSGGYGVACRNNNCNFNENTWPQETKEQAILEWNKMIQLYTFEIGKEYTCVTRTQKKAIEVMWRRGLLWKDVGTGELHVSDKGEEVMRLLEGNV